MNNRFTEIKVTRSGLQGVDKGIAFSADFDLFIIRQAWFKGCDFEDLADGFGKGEGTHSDWSAIRDSSREATNKMLERALNFHFGEKA